MTVVLTAAAAVLTVACIMRAMAFDREFRAFAHDMRERDPCASLVNQLRYDRNVVRQVRAHYGLDPECPRD